MKTKVLSLCITLLMGIAVFAADKVQIGDLYYYLDSSTQTAIVTSHISSSEKYSGDIVIPSAVTYNDTTYSVTSIGYQAFELCTGLTSITIPNSVTSIDIVSFPSCTSLTSIIVESGNTVYDSRENCNAIIETATNTLTHGCNTTIIPNSVTSIGYWAFAGCTALTSITIPESITSIENEAFSCCTALTTVTIPNSVTSIGYYAFYGVPNIVYNGTAKGSPWCAKNVNGYVDGYFVYADATKTTLLACSSAATGAITIPNNVTSIGKWAFSRCTGLTSVTIPNSVTSIGNQAFELCTGLTSITIPNSVTSIGNQAFELCTGLTSITIPNSVTSIGSDAFDNTAWYNNQPDGVIYINKVLYKYKGTMPQGTSIAIKEGTISISGGAMESGAFYRCTGLTSITIPNSVTSIGSLAFHRCTGLTSITIPNSVTSIGNYAFSSCKGLTSITIGNSVTSIGNGAFDGCTSLTSITIPNSVTSIGSRAFGCCTGLTSITIPNSVTSIGGGAFDYCTGLTSVVWNAKKCKCSWSSSSDVPFYSVTDSITSFTFGNEVESIPDCLCYGMSKLTSITIPNGVTSIGWGAFGGCTGLTSITIPNSVTSIGNYAFYNCTGLTSITILAETPPTIQAHTFTDTSLDTIYIPCGTKDAYQAAAIWSNFTNYIETPSYVLTVTAQDEIMGSVRITQEATCSDNTAVFEATANEGYQFVQWSDGNTDNPRTIIVDEDITLTAQFVSTPTAIDNTSTDRDMTTPQKVLIDGQVYILHNGKTYTTTGLEVK